MPLCARLRRELRRQGHCRLLVSQRLAGFSWSQSTGATSACGDACARVRDCSLAPMGPRRCSRWQAACGRRACGAWWCRSTTRTRRRARSGPSECSVTAWHRRSCDRGGEEEAKLTAALRRMAAAGWALSRSRRRRCGSCPGACPPSAWTPRAERSIWPRSSSPGTGSWREGGLTILLVAPAAMQCKR